MERELRLGNDLVALEYLWDTSFESVNWAHWDQLTEIMMWSGEMDIEKRWREDQERGEGISKKP